MALVLQAIVFPSGVWKDIQNNIWEYP